MKFKGKITRSMPSCGDKDIVRIELHDENSGEVVTRIEMGVEEFGYIMCGLSRQKCEFEICNNINRIGKKKEIKYENINTEDISVFKEGEFYKVMIERVKPYEKDGWKVIERDIISWNHHKSKDNLYCVGFERYV
ncbi:hypothetical protein [Clostridium perfringens]|uniref:hypothetical protein n=1 Tax=Clostridium perfringens TaxID=1502 RepID=UPI002342125B|nr:hypothetical protein [Clostridium perfringens]MDC4245570.1 hypothetical protein [Clostridium perfringens]